MKITDELLSGFLDAELPETQMQQIRDALVDDDKLVERLAELAHVDNLVAQHAAQIDHKAIPEEINTLLTDVKQKEQHKVLQMSAWRKVNQAVTRHAAIAAGIALFFGFGLNTWMQDDLPKLDNAVPIHIAKILNTQTSGQTIEAEDGSQVKPYFSFENKQGQYCRQYQLKQAENASANLACRDSQNWIVIASVETVTASAQDQYQTASGESKLADIIESISKGPVFDLTQEQTAIAKNWQTNSK